MAKKASPIPRCRLSMLTPLLLRVVDRELEVHPRDLLATIAPAALPTAAAAVVAALVLETPWPPGVVAAVGAIGGVAVAAVLAFVLIGTDERRELTRTLSR